MTTTNHEALVANDVIAGLRGELQTLQRIQVPVSQVEIVAAFDRIAALEARLAERDTEVGALRAHIDELERRHAAEIAGIKGSATWRLGRVVVAPIGRLTGRSQ
jgi:hypothetical protein